MGMYVWLQESVWSGACTWVCPCVHVCVKESMVEMHSHGHMCLLLCLHRCLHMGLRWPGPGGMIPGMRSLLCLPAWGREAGTAVALTGDGMGLGCLGLQAHRLQGLQAVGMPWALQKHGRNWLDSMAEGRAMCPWILPSLLPSACTMLMGFPSPRTDLRLSGGLEVPGTLN